jgi:hypothetical protein
VRLGEERMVALYVPPYKKRRKTMEQIIIKRRCAWCGVILGTVVWEKADHLFDGAETHGICESCMNKEIAAAVEIKEKWIPACAGMTV